MLVSSKNNCHIPQNGLYYILRYLKLEDKVKKLTLLKCYTFTLCFFVMFSIFINIEAFATDYYIAPSGGSDSEDGRKQSSPWATFSHAMTVLVAGDTLYLMDGTYTYSTSGLIVMNAVTGSPPSGTSGNPITLKALSDGQAIVDGQDVARPLYIHGDAANRVSYIDIEGIQFCNSNSSVVDIDNCDYINFRRITAYDANYNLNTHVYELGGTTYVLLEDCAAWGTGRNCYLIYETQYTTVRRCWGNWGDHSGTGGPRWYMQVYGADNTIVENCVAITENTTKSVSGMIVWANTYNPTADYNKFYGNVVYGYLKGASYMVSSATHNITGNEFNHNVSIDTKYGFRQTGDDNLLINHQVITGTTAGNCFNVDDFHEGYNQDSGFETSGAIKNSVLMDSGRGGLYIDGSGTFGHYANTYNNSYNNVEANWKGAASQGTGEIEINSNYDTTTYGNGAYLMVPNALKGQGENGGNIGAEVIYQYENGKLTNKRLWPWPMEDRILNETGISVTWEANGGLWKTLDGVYSTGDTFISAPKGLMIK